MWPVSYHMDLSRGLGSGKPVPSDSIPLISGYRVGFEDGAAWLYNYDIPCYNIIYSFPGTNLQNIVSGWHLGNYDYWRVIGIEGRHKIAGTDHSCELPGIYFRRIWDRGSDPAYLTFSVSLWYPVLSLAILPLIWIFRRFLLGKKPS